MARFVILVPVLNGAATLSHTLATCCTQDHDGFRIVVSDNHSDDDTARIVRAFQSEYPQVGYIKPDRRLSMSAHWEFALRQLIEEDAFLIVLGSDDALMPGALSYADQLLELFSDVRLLSWGISYYHYPDLPDSNSAGRMLLHLGRDIQLRDTYTWLEHVAHGRANYLGLANVYHGFAHTSLLRELVARGEQLIRSINPDIYLSLAMCCLERRFVFLREPLSLNVISLSSNGFSHSSPEADKRRFTQWMAENDRPFHADLPFSGDLGLMHGECLLQLRDAGILPVGIDPDWHSMLGRAMVSTHLNYQNSALYEERMAQLRSVAERFSLVPLFEAVAYAVRYAPNRLGTLLDMSWYIQPYDYSERLPAALVSDSRGAALYARELIRVDEHARGLCLDSVAAQLAGTDSGDKEVTLALLRVFVREINHVSGAIWTVPGFLQAYVKCAASRPPLFNYSLYLETLFRLKHVLNLAGILPECDALTGMRQAKGHKLRLVVYSYDLPDWACPQIRLLRPIEHLQDAFEVVWAVRSDGNNFTYDEQAYLDADLVVVQRFFPEPRTADLLDKIFKSGIPVIYETDDLLIDMPLDHPIYLGIKNLIPNILECMWRANVVTVSTPALKQALHSHCRDIRVVPNFVEEDYFLAPVPVAREVVTIGILGTPTHATDFALLDEALDRILASYHGQVRIVFMGVVPDRWAKHSAVSHVSFEYDYRTYAEKLKALGLDIALVPLADNAFNRAKSNIKWLEYSAAGIAGIYSDLPPYETVRHGLTGYKVVNTSQAWYDAIHDLIEHPEKRVAIATAAQKEVLELFSTEVGSRGFARTYKEILAVSSSSAMSSESRANWARFSRKRKLVTYSRDLSVSSCAQVRLIRPFIHLHADWELVLANDAGRNGLGVLDETLLRDADLIVLQRSFPGKDTEQLLEAIFASRKLVIYETDDLLTDLPEDNPHYAEFAFNKSFIEDAMRRAHAVVVSTPGLAQRLSGYNANIRILPNFLDYNLFYRPLPDNGRKVNIAVAGTSARPGDFRLIDAALRAICAEYGSRIRIKFIGAIPESWVGHANAESVPFTPDYGGYAARMKSLELDIGLAPLEDNAFNACKSAIKWLEFSALGMAGVYSHVPAYRDVIEQGKTGLLVDNQPEKWITALKLLIDNLDFRREIALSAQLKVYQEHSLQRRANLVNETYRDLLRDFAASGEGAVAPEADAAVVAPGSTTAMLDYYALWQAGHGYQEWDLRWMADRMAAWGEPARVRLGVICRAGREDLLAHNLKCLSAQFHPGWHLAVLAETDAPDGLEELTRVSWHKVPPDFAIASLNDALLGGEEDWVGMVEAGDRLPLHATFAVADAAKRHPEWRMLFSDEDRLAADGTRHTPFFKTDFDADMLRCAPFCLGGLLLLKRDLFAELSGLRPQAEGVLTWDLALRASERLSAGEVGHLADVLYHRHEEGAHCLREPEQVWQVAGECLREHLSRLGWGADVEDGPLPGSFRIRHHILDNPLVSIIVPTKNKVDLLRNCLTSLIEGTQYSHCEVLVVDNGSDDPETLAYLRALRELGSNSLKVLSFPGPFNFSAMNNLAARQARGEYLLLLNNDTQVLHEDWLEEMLGYAQREDVGAVGARLLYPDGSIQHAGAILGLGGMGSNHVFSKVAGDDPGYYGRLMLPQAYSAVTAACLLTRKTHYEAVGGLDETTFQVNFNDVDYCLKLRERGLKVIWTPHATLRHEESVSQAAADVELLAREEKYKRLYREVEAVVAKWPHWFANDPAYNRNLSLIQPFQPEPTPALTWDPEWRPAPRVLSIHADTMGCGEYRIIAPMRALTRAGKVMGWDAAGYFHPREYARMDPESVVFQRQLEWGQIEFMQRIARITKAFRVYELDDLISNIPIMSSQKKLFVEQKDVNKRFRKAVSLCHRFVVSTEYLAEAFKGYCDDIVVVPNYLERARWEGYRPMRRGGAKARVGWAGSATHAGDLRLIVDVVKATADEVDWIFFGMCPDAIRPLVREFHEPVKLDDYAAKLASLDLDLAIAPLEDIPFNHGKSHLRLLEYGVMGYPVVCSDITPYRGAFPVARVAPKFKAWVEAIRERVADRDALAREGDALRDHVQRHWMLEDHLDVWLRAWLPPTSGFSERSR